MVPGSSFACPGYVRLAYCVSYDTIINSLPEFKKLAEEFGLWKRRGLTLGQQRVELENQERLLRLTSISNPSKVCSLTWSIGDYQDVQIEDNSVIICDIPYIGTNEYVGGGDNFDHERFYEWCLKQKEPLYICSYEMPEKDFKVVAEFARIDTMSASCNNKKVIEKVFVPAHQYDKISYVIMNNELPLFKEL